MKKLVNKGGRNYLLDIGGPIGGQIKSEEKEIKQRETDIWIGNARTISNNITLQLPKGYIADGLQDLNFNIDNESGSFVSSAHIEGEKVLVSTKKVYKKNSIKRSPGGIMLHFQTQHISSHKRKSC